MNRHYIPTHQDADDEELDELLSIPAKYRDIDDVQFEKFRKRDDWD